jgi:hypothetical protein
MIIHQLSYQQLNMLDSIFTKPSVSEDENYMVWTRPDWLQLLYTHIKRSHLDAIAYAAIDSQIGDL